MSKHDISNGTLYRNHYMFDTVYVWSGVAYSRVSGFGHIDVPPQSSYVGSIILTCSTGNISGYYSTVHSY